MSGDYAYIADADSGLAIIDISDPTNPGTPVYEDTSGSARGVFVSGDYAYMADRTSGLAVIRVRITDFLGPSIDASRIPISPDDMDTVTVTATVTDSAGVAEVKISYSTDGQSTWTNVTMVFQSGNNWTATIPSQSADTTVYYKVYGRDSVDNWATSATDSYLVVISDTDGPLISVGSTPSSPTDADDVVVTATVTDSGGVAEVKLSYSTDGQSTWTNLTMTFVSGNNWTATIPSQSVDTVLYFKVYAVDILDNWAVSATESYTVISVATITTTTTGTTTTTTTTTQTNGLEPDPAMPILIAGGGAAIIAVVAALFIVKRRRPREPSPELPPTPPPDEPEEPIVEDEVVEALLVTPVVEEKEPELPEGVHALRGCAAVGGKFEYKVKIINNTEFVVNDVTVSVVSFPEVCMGLPEGPIKKIPKIEPGGFRSPQFTLVPTKDCVEGDIVASVSYMDHRHSLEMIEVEPYTIRSVCDLLEPMESSLEEFETLLYDMSTNSEEIRLDRSPKDAFSDMMVFLPERNFEIISSEGDSVGEEFHGTVMGLACGKYTGKKIAVRIVVSGQVAARSANVLVEALGEDADMLPTTIEEMVEGLKVVAA
ncbi:MAG: hypothetical protein ACW99U_10685 [Candidatus Thorarchaeota archaeon]